MAVSNGGPPTEPGKIFVGGLSWDTTADGLRSYFSKFGEVSDSVIMKDSQTNKPRGFGFVTFADQESVVHAVSGGPHILDGKTIDPKPATVKGQSHVQPLPQQQVQQRYQDSGQGNERELKIFVGGLSAETTEEDVRNYFSIQGTVKDVDLKRDKQTNRMRGFGFVTFDSEEVVENIIRTHYHQINGKTVEAKKAEARGQSQGAQNQTTYSSSAAAAVAAAYQQYGAQQNLAAAAAAYGTAGSTTNANNYYQYSYPYYYQQQWPPSYGGTGQQSSMGTTGYSTQDSRVYTQTAAAEGYGTQSQTYGYDNTRQTPAASYPQQTYGDSSANYVSAMGQHSTPAQQQRGGNYYSN